jgi:hypothetical protein
MRRKKNPLPDQNNVHLLQFLLLMKVYATRQLEWTWAAVPVMSVLCHGIVLVHGVVE